jgi:HKD family nuclease
MRQSRTLVGSQRLADEFARCCAQYDRLELAVAWCGNPNQTLPYKHLENFRGAITATIGTSFNHTHPVAIEWLTNLKGHVRIFRDSGKLFHPKVYLFSDRKRYALFVGSSNFTYGGFYSNVEVNSLIEGDFTTGRAGDIRQLQEQLSEWHSDAYSFKPTASWLDNYRRDYSKTARELRELGLKTPPRVEEEIGTGSWLKNADWPLYIEKVTEGLKQRERNGRGYHDVLDAAAHLVPIPWTASYFADAENRRVIGGIGDYGWLGHVAASGQFRHLLANGRKADWETMARCINAASSLAVPLPWKRVEGILDQLVNLGFTMKVWGRLLCIVRPDLYCTVASVSVRTNLSAILRVPQSSFEKPAGYLQLVRLIHGSPWFASNRPTGKTERAIWDRRAAFLDAVFY